ncbi:MAG: hypothetical protein O2951_19000, partial [Bacteroidetes bacterium]|nr:hypothetical protein [Bacteroidota bacterium]
MIRSILILIKYIRKYDPPQAQRRTNQLISYKREIMKLLFILVLLPMALTRIIHRLTFIQS